ncbi:MAG: PQQ-binding-like beta-propeller repeat protein [Haloplanus sp.]
MPSITRRRLLGSGAAAALAAGAYGAYRLHRGATDAAFASWTPAPDTWPLRRYDPANTAHNPTASPPRESPSIRTIARASTTARQPSFTPLVGVDHVGMHDSGLAVWPRRGGEAVLERDASTPLAGFGPDGRLHTVESNPATVVGYVPGEREAYRHQLRDGDDPVGLTVGAREVYVGCESGALQGLDPDNDRRWRVDGARPVLADGRLYAADAPLDGTVAYAPRTGVDRRLEVGPERVWNAGPTDGFPHAPAVADGRVVLGTYAEGGGVVAAIDADTGERLWEPRPLGRDVATPAVASDRDRGYTAVETADGAGFVAALDLATGETRWRDAVEWAAGTPVLGGETLLVAGERADGSGVVRAYDAAGDALWTQAFEGGRPGGLAPVGDRVLVTVGATLYELR